jgi:hypothetical protein
MQTTDQTIYQALETLAAAFPWDRVSVWVDRQPEGIYSFTVYIAENQKTGGKSIFSSETDLQKAVEETIKQSDSHDPEVTRKKRIQELEMELLKLKTRMFSLPPYRAPNQVGYGERAPVEPIAAQFITLDAKSEEVA